MVGTSVIAAGGHYIVHRKWVKGMGGFALQVNPPATAKREGKDPRCAEKEKKYRINRAATPTRIEN
ncbi:MAG: hypothetical protein ACI91F_003233 [Candidatus Binatia bacterium]